MAGGAVVDRPAAVGAEPGGPVHTEGKQDAMGAGLERDFTDAPGGVLPQGDYPRSIPAGRRR